MKSPHFDKILLTIIIFVFGGMAIWMLKHGEPEDGFKWAVGMAQGALGALLMLMRPFSNRDAGPPPNQASPEFHPADIETKQPIAP